MASSFKGGCTYFASATDESANCRYRIQHERENGTCGMTQFRSLTLLIFFGNK